MFVRELGFLRLNLTFPMENRASVYKALFGPKFRVCRDCFDSLVTDAVMKGVKVRGKTALRWECELMYNQNYVNVTGSQLFRASGNTETGFSNLIYIAFINPACQCLWGPALSMSPPECLFKPLIWGVLADDVDAETFAG